MTTGCPPVPGVSCAPMQLAARLPKRAWQRLSAGKGAKGQRYYDWAWITISDSAPGCRWLLIRRHPRTGELAFYRCYAPQPVTLAALVKAAGLRWTIEENFQAGKGLTGLDEHQVRSWTSWHRWVTLAMLASAFLAIAAAAERARNPRPSRADPADPQRDRQPLRRPDHRARRRRPRTGCAGPPGAGDTSTEPRQATTSGKPGTHEHNDLRLEY